MTDTIPGDESIQRIYDQFDQLYAWAARAEMAEAELSRQKVELWSPGRQLRVVLEHTGVLAEVQYAESAMGLSPMALAQLTMRTMRLAMAELLRRVDAIALETGDPGLAQLYETSYHSTLDAHVARLGEV